MIDTADDVKGKWQFSAETPMGQQVFEMDIVPDGNSFAAQVHGDFGDFSVPDGVIEEGLTLQGTLKVKKPMPLKLKFSVAPDGDGLAGTAKVPGFGIFRLTGVRAE